MKIVSIHQPHYHPWLGLLHKIASSDLHIVLDDVQFRKRNFQNRAQYSSPNGPKLLTVPVLAKGHQKDNLAIKDVRLAPQNLGKQFSTLKHRYGKTPGWHLLEDRLKSIYDQSFDRLSDLNLALLRLSMDAFHIDTPLIQSSSITSSGHKNHRLISLCEQTRATHYLSGNGARKYMDDVLFARNGIKVRYQDFQHPEYKQIQADHFQAGCFALDFFFHHPKLAQTLFIDDTQLKHEVHYAQA